MTGLGEDVYTAPDHICGVDEMVEGAARAIGETTTVPGLSWLQCQARAALESLGVDLAVLAALKAGTWQAVPRSCTQPMATAGFSKMNEVGKREIEQIYLACISAAPKAPEAAR